MNGRWISKVVGAVAALALTLPTALLTSGSRGHHPTRRPDRRRGDRDRLAAGHGGVGARFE